ncbi:MAG: DUF1553 domain-containing protein, partial [Planctomycetales bacterium]|nr:DUF1553 domain-containing protein [Planctomycetales bacterium]
WVIRSLRDDMPYDRFVQMQLAGDLLEPESLDGLAATGFLVAGIHNTVVGQSETMRRTARHAELEELATTTSQAFLGLTIHCARCHDHKFDPIRSREYYQFIAALDTVHHGTRPYQHQADSPRLEQDREERARLRLALLDSVRRTGRTLSSSGNAIVSSRAIAKLNERDADYIVRCSLAPTVYAAPSQQTIDDDGLRLELIRDDGTTLWSTDLRPGAWSNDPADQRFRTFTTDYLGDGSGPVRWRVSSLLHEGRFGGAIDSLTVTTLSGEVVFEETFDDLEPRNEPARQADSELVIHWGMRSDRWEAVGLNAIHAVEHTPGNWAVQLFGGSLDGPLPLETDEQRAIDRQLRELDSRLAPIPIYTIVPGGPTTMHVMRRGDPMQPLEAVAPGGLAAIAGPTADFELPLDATDADRRLALARWVTHPENGPFHRTMVNRVWHYHFGQGLVPTPSDLGWAGGQPSHPELLEWLAAWFRDEGRSIKQLHRLIVTSHAYRQSSAPRTSQASIAARMDADNRLLWRQNPRRLDAESVRDALLSAAGRLDQTLFGPGYRDVKIEVIGAAHYYQPIDESQSATLRRSLYRWRVRADRAPLLEAFDCPEPSTPTPVRGSTSSPTQALSLWNDPLVLSAARWTAEDIAARAGEDPARQATMAWRRILARDPEPRELATGRTLVESQGLDALCRVLFNTTEFVVID